jgi:hypothetical protein
VVEWEVGPEQASENEKPANQGLAPERYGSTLTAAGVMPDSMEQERGREGEKKRVSATRGQIPMRGPSDAGARRLAANRV